MLTSGEVLQDRYRIVSLLGQGGMGAVYKAVHLSLNIPVAVKQMVPQPGIDPKSLTQLQAQFRQEATVLAQLSHTNLVRVIDFFQQDGSLYLVMEYVEGSSLAELIAQQGPLPEEQVLAWADQLLQALAYCHDKGIIHRDIKPLNIIVRSDGQAVLVDFGLVKLWNPDDPRTKTIIRSMGSPEYAPPEQWGTEPGSTDARSDLYSFGATLYHALTGKTPPTANDRMANPEKFSATRTLNHQVSAYVDAVVGKAMALVRNERFASAEEMRLALMGQTTVPRQKIPIWIWAVVTVLLVGLLGAGVWRLSHAPAKPTTSISTPRATLLPTVTSRPSSTPRPTASPTPRPSSTPRLSPTPKSATATPASAGNRPTAMTTPAEISVPILLEPGAGTALGTGITFSWQGVLSANQAFVVYLRHLESGHTEQSAQITANTWTISLPADRFGEWRWRVGVVENGALQLQSEERHFWLSPFPGGDDDADAPSPGVSPLSAPVPLSD